MSEPVVILGAGLAGLSAAWHFGGNSRVYEKESQPGGLARTSHVDEFSFDYAGHLLHFKTEEGLRLVERLLAGGMVRYERNAWIFSHSTLTPYPFQASTCGLPAHIVKQCILGMLNAQRSEHGETGTLRDWLVGHFGEGISRYFLYPYNHKFWTVPPEQLIPDWAQRFVPIVGIKDVVKGAFSQKIKAFGYNSLFWYPRTGGIEQLVHSICRELKPVHTGMQAVRIDPRKKEVRFRDGRVCAFSRLVSTIPLPELGQLLHEHAPPQVRTAFSRLRWVSIYNLNLGIEGRLISDKHWIYFPEKNFVFFRVGFPMNFSNRIVPPGASSLYAEVSYSPEKPLLRKTIRSHIFRDLRRCGILRGQDRIVAENVQDMKYAYVRYDHDYRESVGVIAAYLKSQDIYPCGRLGSWSYMSMEDALLDGKRVAEELALHTKRVAGSR